MTELLSEKIQNLNMFEIAELTGFADFLITKRIKNRNEAFLDDIPTKEITDLISNSEAFDWLDSIYEDVYLPTDGTKSQW